MARKKKTDDDLLTFDEDSPLFVKPKTTSKKKTTTKPKYKSEAEIASEGEPVEAVKKRKQKTKSKLVKENPDAPKYKIETPNDCKHILPAFKKILTEKWKTLKSGTGLQAGEVANYLRGVATVAKESRPKEYEEILVLIMVARKIANEQNRSTQQEPESGTEVSA